MTELDLVDEKREQTVIHTIIRNQVVTKYYNKRFQPKTFKVGDPVLKKVMVQKPRLGSFGPKLEGPIRVIGIVRSGTYQLVDQDTMVLGQPWNVDHIKCFYQ